MTADSRMRLTVIGCSGSFPGPDSASSCYLVEAPHEGRTFRMLLDLGSGALGSLQRHVSLDLIDAVALSHLHPDHCIDLCGYYVVRKYLPGGPLPRLRVYGPPAAGEHMARAYGIEDERGMTSEFEFATYSAEPFSVGPFRVEARLVDHPVPAYSIKVEFGGRTLVYSGDTGPCLELEDLARGSDMLLAEASFVEGENNPPHMHLTGREAALIAAKHDVGRLVLTHVPPWYSPQQAFHDARPHFDGELCLAVPGASYVV